jgi:hypothetical protein
MLNKGHFLQDFSWMRQLQIPFLQIFFRENQNNQHQKKAKENDLVIATYGNQRESFNLPVKRVNAKKYPFYPTMHQDCARTELGEVLAFPKSILNDLVIATYGNQRESFNLPVKRVNASS